MSTLSSTRVPDPLGVDKALLRKVIRLVDERLQTRGQDAFLIEKQIDEIVADLYSLTPAERRLVGFEEKIQ